MSRTKHHKDFHHVGEDYGSKHNCNKLYNQSYGKYGRQRLHEELRMQDKEIIKQELEQLDAENDQ